MTNHLYKYQLSPPLTAGNVFNLEKYYEENPDRIYKVLDIRGKNKPFDVFKLDGTFIKTFNYRRDAQEYLQKEYNIDKRIGIYMVVSEKRMSANDFVFKYKE